MFQGASAFNGDISLWDVSKLTLMRVSIVSSNCLCITKILRDDQVQMGMMLILQTKKV